MTTHEYYDNNDLSRLKSVSKEDLSKHAITKDLLNDLVQEGLVEKYGFDILYADQITISPSDNVAQSTGNTPEQIKTYAKIFKDKRFSPFVDVLPMIIKQSDGSYLTSGGYKRVLGAQECSVKIGQKITIPVIVIDPASGIDIDELQLRVNVIENTRPPHKNPDKTSNTADTYANALIKELKDKGICIKSLSTEDLRGVMKKYAVSRDGFKVGDIINIALQKSGVEVPIYTDTAESEDAVRKLLLEEYRLDIDPVVKSYSANGEAIVRRDRWGHYIESVKSAVLHNKSHVFIVVQHTGVTPDQAKEFNEQYLEFEREGGTFKDMYFGKEDQTPPVPVIFGVINNGIVTWTDDNWMKGLDKLGKLDLEE